ncbi:thiamine pyrophosphate-dependent enzyme [Okeania hirsuta]|uniref:thiamine pyrophosphate-dependent enzyme n=1 Tax=Okeania hirsuta TaxID=1458930 RepID=UPI0019612353|nr:thiamine pyrophosphate-dependent enzyme [Okeania hirsuta]
MYTGVGECGGKLQFSTLMVTTLEAVLFASELALEYRQAFNNDVFIDMVCYRKHGHNEGDDPKFTQPGWYKVINEHPTPREVYQKQIVGAR